MIKNCKMYLKCNCIIGGEQIARPSEELSGPSEARREGREEGQVALQAQIWFQVAQGEDLRVLKVQVKLKLLLLEA